MSSMKVRKERFDSVMLSQARRSKVLYMPMPRADADALMLRSHIALEVVRIGRANAASVKRLATVVTLTRFLTEAGFGHLGMEALSAAENALAGAFAIAGETDVWSFSKADVGVLTLVVNEHDRQLVETQLSVIVAAGARLDRLIRKDGSS